ncbi:MAG: hypothetical protein UHP28_05445 [Treponema sp.]|nr:hypothetical protein [Treponema sp.]
MLSYFFRKNFSDGWDNVQLFFAPNIILDLCMIVCGFLITLGVNISGSYRDLSLAILISFIFVVMLAFSIHSIMSLAWAQTARHICESEPVSLKEYFDNLKSCIKDGIKFGMFNFFASVATFTGFWFYFDNFFRTRDVTGLFAGCIFMWIAVCIFMAAAWYPSLRAYMRNGFWKSMKKCFIVLFDNLAVNIVLLFYSLILFTLSIILLGCAPGMCGLEMARVNAMRLFMKKYDYLEELDKNNVPSYDPSRRVIPWNKILEEDYDMLGDRNFKSFLKPWKD